MKLLHHTAIYYCEYVNIRYHTLSHVITRYHTLSHAMPIVVIFKHEAWRVSRFGLFMSRFVLWNFPQPLLHPYLSLYSFFTPFSIDYSYIVSFTLFGCQFVNQI